MNYEYGELLKKAMKGEEGAVDHLADWFSSYGMQNWNGEAFIIDEKTGLFPLYEGNDEDIEVVGYEIKNI